MALRKPHSNPMVHVAIGFALIATVALATDIVDWGFNYVGLRPRSPRESSTWAAALVCLVAFVSVMAEYLRRKRLRVRPGHCPRCRYDVSGNRNSRCPECGTALSILVRCPGCGGHIESTFDLAGRATACPKCLKERVLPEIGDAVVVESSREVQ